MPAEDDFSMMCSMMCSPPRRGQRAGGDSDMQQPSPHAELCDMILKCNLALIPNVENWPAVCRSGSCKMNSVNGNWTRRFDAVERYIFSVFFIAI
jgi:hypothetical protein